MASFQVLARRYAHSIMQIRSVEETENAIDSRQIRCLS
jgi:hypothetical protein